MFDFAKARIRFGHNLEEVTLSSEGSAQLVMMVEVDKMKKIFKKRIYGIGGQVYTITGEKLEKIPMGIPEVIE